MVRPLQALTSTPAQLVYGILAATAALGNQLVFNDVTRVAQAFSKYCYDNATEGIYTNSYIGRETAETLLGTICIWSVPLLGAALSASIVYRMIERRRPDTPSAREDAATEHLLRGDV